jgi:2-dehydro-3-deoxygalactonokinase
MERNGLIAIDWGTTNRRIFVIDAQGALEHREADSRGVLAIPAGGFANEIAALRVRFGDRLFLLAGMVGSTRGWVEASYVPCPVTVPALVDKLLWVEPDRIAIVPGACVANEACPDVMRGEEVQLLGALAAGLVHPDSLLCLPGTHAKWAMLQGGALTAFRTIMTGEMFALLRNHSILSPQLSGVCEDGPAFRSGVRRGHDDGALLADLFGARARILLGRLRDRDMPSYVSGLLIGADLRIGLEGAPAGMISLIGDPDLTRLYGVALDEAGRSFQEIDGEQAFLAGIKAIAEKLP